MQSVTHKKKKHKAELQSQSVQHIFSCKDYRFWDQRVKPTEAVGVKSRKQRDGETSDNMW